MESNPEGNMSGQTGRQVVNKPDYWLGGENSHEWLNQLQMSLFKVSISL